MAQEEALERRSKIFDLDKVREAVKKHKELVEAERKSTMEMLDNCLDSYGIKQSVDEYFADLKRLFG